MNDFVYENRLHRNKNAEKLWILSLILFFAVALNYTWRLSYFLWYGSLAFLFIMYTLTNNGIVFKFTKFIWWMLLFTLLACLSLVWSISRSTSMDVIKNLIVLFVALYLIQTYIKSKDDIILILKCLFVATIINAVYVLLNIDLEQLGEVQIGNEMLEGWNGNGIGFMMSNGVLIGCYLLRTTKNKYLKFFYILIIILLTYIVLNTGSRTAFIVTLFGLLFFIIINQPKKIVRNLVISIVVLVAAYFLIMNVEGLYNVLGVRMEGLLSLFTGKGEADHSALVRDAFVRNGLTWFTEKPIFGFGINNYKNLNLGATGLFTYAHNNYVEMAVNLGVIGFIAYYGLFIYLIVVMLKKIRQNKLTPFLLAMLLTILLSQFGSVNYDKLAPNLILMLCCTAVNLKTDDKEIKNNL